MTASDIDGPFGRRMACPYARGRRPNPAGPDGHGARQAGIPVLSANPAGPELPANGHRPNAGGVPDAIPERPPLAALAGAAGYGKTGPAENTSDRATRRGKVGVAPYPTGPVARGRVCRPVEPPSAAFRHVMERAQKPGGTGAAPRGAVTFLADEADTVARSRGIPQMRRGDRAWMNAFMRGIDRLARAKLPVAATMYANRMGSPGPAMRRRAAGIPRFARPDDGRRAAAPKPLRDPGLSGSHTVVIARAAGARHGAGCGFAFSDTTRPPPALVFDASSDGAVDPDLAAAAGDMLPTEPFREANDG